jgi:hypothetical protein
MNGASFANRTVGFVADGPGPALLFLDMLCSGRSPCLIASRSSLTTAAEKSRSSSQKPTRSSSFLTCLGQFSNAAAQQIRPGSEVSRSAANPLFLFRTTTWYSTSFTTYSTCSLLLLADGDLSLFSSPGCFLSLVPVESENDLASSTRYLPNAATRAEDGTTRSKIQSLHFYRIAEEKNLAPSYSRYTHQIRHKGRGKARQGKARLGRVRLSNLNVGRGALDDGGAEEPVEVLELVAGAGSKGGLFAEERRREGGFSYRELVRCHIGDGVIASALVWLGLVWFRDGIERHI